MRYVHRFEEAPDNVTLLGGKGASLARMCALGLPIPPGFTITTTAWRAWREGGDAVLSEIRVEVAQAMTHLEGELGRTFGDPANPLLISVRSGAPRSMPGMMDTILNLGLTDETVEGLAAHTSGDFAYNVYARLLAMYARIVRDVPADAVHALERRGDRSAVAELKAVIEAHCEGRSLPQAADEQLSEAIEAVWRSWDSRRAKRYRRYAGIPDDLGTAVTVQAMVFGNRDDQSGTGVVFTRDPATGSPGVYGDFLPRAQGEDVVAGGRNTEPLSAMQYPLPKAYEDLEAALPVIEAAYRDMTDVEFTVESTRLWILQARPGQRSGPAAVRIAVDMVDEGFIGVEEALDRIPLSAIEQLQAPVFATRDGLDVLGRGTPAAPGAAVGVAVFDSERAQDLGGPESHVILLRPETSPEDIGGMIASAGIVTAVGGRTSHAAVIARGIGRPAVCGVKGLDIDPAARRAQTPDGREIVEGDVVAVDGNEGLLVLGAVKLVPAQPDLNVARMLVWCDERVKLPIVSTVPDGYVRATEPEDAADCGGRPVLVDVLWEGASSAVLLEKVVAAALENGCDALALRMPETLAGADLRPPEAPWTHLVVTPGKEWTARLLAARLTPSPTPAR